jgi:hypothetical protein
MTNRSHLWPQLLCGRTVFAIGHPLLEEHLQRLASVIGYKDHNVLIVLRLQGRGPQRIGVGGFNPTLFEASVLDCESACQMDAYFSGE